MIISGCRKTSQILTSLHDKNNKPVERNIFNLIKGIDNNNNKKSSSQLTYVIGKKMIKNTEKTKTCVLITATQCGTGGCSQVDWEGKKEISI